MTRYTASQVVLAFVLVAVGAVKGVRLVMDQIDDAVTHVVGLS